MRVIVHADVQLRIAVERNAGVSTFGFLGKDDRAPLGAIYSAIGCDVRIGGSGAVHEEELGTRQSCSHPAIDDEGGTVCRRNAVEEDEGACFAACAPAHGRESAIPGVGRALEIDLRRKLPSTADTVTVHMLC